MMGQGWSDGQIVHWLAVLSAHCSQSYASRHQSALVFPFAMHDEAVHMPSHRINSPAAHPSTYAAPANLAYAGSHRTFDEEHRIKPSRSICTDACKSLVLISRLLLILISRLLLILISRLLLVLDICISTVILGHIVVLILDFDGCWLLALARSFGLILAVVFVLSLA